MIVFGSLILKAIEIEWSRKIKLSIIRLSAVVSLLRQLLCNFDPNKTDIKKL